MSCYAASPAMQEGRDGQPAHRQELLTEFEAYLLERYQMSGKARGPGSP